MKRIHYLKFITLTAITFLTSVSVSAQNLEWARSVGSTSDDEASSVVVDASGNVYTTGSFNGTVDFDPGAGIFNLTSAGNSDIFIQKLDAVGNFVWAKQIGGTDLDKGNKIAIDADNNVYITGLFWLTADFDPGLGTFNLTSNGIRDAFVCKLDASGNFIWANAFGSTTYDEGSDIVVDVNGNVHVIGSFVGTVDFDPGVGVTSLTTPNGNSDVFVVKLSASGSLVWAKSWGGPGDEAGRGIAVDILGNVYTVGAFISTVDFDPGVGTNNLTSANSSFDVFLSKLDASGNFVWAKRWGGMNEDAGNSLTIDANGNIYTIGTFMNTVDFDPGSSTSNLVSSGFRDVFVSKLDVNGDYLWAKRWGAGSEEAGIDIAVDGSGNVYTTGAFGGTVDFNPSAASYPLTALAARDIFVSKLNSAGNFVWANRAGSGSYNFGMGLSLDYASRVHVAGYFNGTADFDPGAGTSNLVSNGGNDVFVWKLSSCNVELTENKTACESYTWRNGQTYSTNQSGVLYTVPGVAAGGCDSIYVLNLTITANTVDLTTNASSDVSCFGSSDGIASVNAATGGTGVYTYNWSPGTPSGDGTTTISGLITGDYTCIATDENGCSAQIDFTITQPALIVNNMSETACDIFMLNGEQYSQTGVYTQNLVATNGCDSVIVLSLTVNHSSSATQSVTACNSYTYNGQTYTTSGMYPHTFPAANGCDSIINLMLAITNSPNVSIINNEMGVLTSSVASSYQWINCATNQIINGETNVTFTPSQNGTYAVIGFSNGTCSDTSACVVVNNVGLEGLNLIEVNIVPNPANDFVTISFENDLSAVLLIRDAQGKEFLEKVVFSDEKIDLRALSSGVYFFELHTSNGRTIKRVVKS